MKYTSLYYLEESKSYAPDLFIDQAWSIQDYIMAVKFPEPEMSGKNPEDYALDYIKFTSNENWHWKIARKIEAGDIFTHSDKYWAYLDMNDFAEFVSRGFETRKLPDWTSLFIGKLKEEIKEECLT